jgi:4-hydroxy 2-oxovalerate aldolase
MQILDCTLRDGGYYNNWDFSKEFVNDYLATAEAMGIEYIEIGFRLNSNRGFKGSCAYSSDEFLKSLNIPKKISVGVMINASEFDSGSISRLEKLFPNDSQEYLDFVRIAAVKSELSVANQLADILSKKGYTIFLNIMQMATLSKSDLEVLCKSISNSVDILYFADSTGSLKPEEVRDFFKIVQSYWSKPLGLHAHDNLSMALVNTLSAAANGVEWQDSTFMGMGRGPGNSRTELLWLETQGEDIDFQGMLVGQEFIFRRMTELKKEFAWGTDPYYYLAGNKKIHPTFVQNLHGDESLSEFDKIGAIKNLSNSNSLKFSEALLDQALMQMTRVPQGDWNPSENISNVEILILANSSSLQKHSNAVELFIERHRPYVLALNWNDFIDPNLIDSYISCHPHKVLGSIERAKSREIPIITPVALLTNNSAHNADNPQVRNYGVQVVKGSLVDKGNYCEIPNMTSIAYALAVATSNSTKRIFLAGFDGKFKNTRKFQETEKVFKIFGALHIDVSLISLTNTDYSVKSQSIYGVVD